MYIKVRNVLPCKATKQLPTKLHLNKPGIFDYPGTLVPTNKMIPQYTLDYLTTNILIKNRGVSYVHVFDFN